MFLISHMFLPVNRSEKKIFNVNIDRLLRYITSTRILASIPDALWDMCKLSRVIYKMFIILRQCTKYAKFLAWNAVPPKVSECSLLH